MTKLIFGCGYLGRRVAQRWRVSGSEVVVVTRDTKHAAAFAADGYRPLVADVLRPASLIGLPVAETVLYAVGYDRGTGASIHEVFIAGLQSVLAALPAETGKFLYISSTGVYGQSQGEQVNEDSPCEPQRDGGRACLAAERALAAHTLGRHAVVLRMAGLYGPGRIPYASELRRQQPIPAPQHGFLNLIHVDDAVAAVLAAEARATPPRTYAIADGHPVERHVYYEELARALKAPPPRFAPPPADAPAQVRAASSKRLCNARMVAELGVKLAYPSYREGLAAIFSPANAAASRD
jgi:nucleoside-diphosphate-sugar epimerase